MNGECSVAMFDHRILDMNVRSMGFMKQLRVPIISAAENGEPGRSTDVISSAGESPSYALMMFHL